MTHQKRKIIIVNDNVSKGRVRFSIAHELGHYFLRHGPVALNMLNCKDRPTHQEVDANAFASELLMSKPLLNKYG